MAGQVNQSGDNAAVERLVARRTRLFVAVIERNGHGPAVGVGVNGSWA